MRVDVRKRDPNIAVKYGFSDKFGVFLNVSDKRLAYNENEPSSSLNNLLSIFVIPRGEYFEACTRASTFKRSVSYWSMASFLLIFGALREEVKQLIGFAILKESAHPPETCDWMDDGVKGLAIKTGEPHVSNQNIARHKFPTSYAYGTDVYTGPFLFAEDERLLGQFSEEVSQVLDERVKFDVGDPGVYFTVGASKWSLGKKVTKYSESLPRVEPAKIGPCNGMRTVGSRIFAFCEGGDQVCGRCLSRIAKDCQKLDWKTHKLICKNLPFPTKAVKSQREFVNVIYFPTNSKTPQLRQCEVVLNTDSNYETYETLDFAVRREDVQVVLIVILLVANAQTIGLHDDGRGLKAIKITMKLGGWY
ncbi:hypothetical protein HK098_004281 [Nowakowskiella sp. JEL0407]|nr:hypothetical protein HK098_004281 [Nowakowskiella sp. JEL0407]